ncbi:hypothetical protein EV426DRAFT_663857 [Tirmania nivea]|nr:hypothetical protein EV426DRAFT_663857 [Tirmania nivea]
MPSPTYICPPCRRLLLTPSTATTPRLLHKRFSHTHLPAPTSPPLQFGLVNLSLPLSPTTIRPQPRTLLSLHGPDATKFLQAVTTIDIPPLTTTTPASAYSGFLNAQGRLLWEGFVYNVNGSKAWRERVGGVSVGAGGVGGARGKWGVDDPCWFVETSGEGAEGLKRWLGRYVLRSKVTITPVPTVGEAGEGGWDIWAAWGGTPAEGSLGGVENIESTPTANDNRAPGLFTRYLLPTRLPADIPEGGDRKATLSDYNLRRYLHGIAESPPELTPPERSLPHEYNLDLYPPPHGLSFRKGCYVGQELTVRTQHRGVVRKRVIPVQLSPGPAIPPTYGGVVYDPTVQLDIPPPGEAEIVSCHSQVHEGGVGRVRSAGRFIAGVGNVGIALVRLESVFGQGWEGDVGTREGGRWGGEGFKVVWEEGMGGGEGGEVEGGVRRREVDVRAWMPGWHFRDAAGERGR